MAGAIFALDQAARELAEGGIPASSVTNVFNDISAETLCAASELERQVLVSSLSRLLRHFRNRESPLIWTIIGVIELVSHEDKFLILFQRLIPEISYLLLSQTSEDRKVRLLQLFEALTFGVRITRSDSFLAPVLSKLVNFCTSGDKIPTSKLSLCCLVNLLHQNPVVLSTLRQTVNLKKMMKDLLHLRTDVICRMEVCKLMFLLEDVMYGSPGEQEVSNFIKVTCSTVLEMKPPTQHLKHTVTFFKEMVKQKWIVSDCVDQPWFTDWLKGVIRLLDSISHDGALLMFEFLEVFVTMKVPSLPPFYEGLIRQGVELFKKSESNPTQVIKFLHSVLLVMTEGRPSVIDGLNESDLTEVILPALSNYKNNNDEFVTALMDLLCAALDYKAYSVAITSYLKQPMIDSLLSSLPCHLENHKVSQNHLKMYMNILFFLSKVVTAGDRSWLKFYNTLLCEQNIVTVIAIALLHGSSALKFQALHVMHSVGFAKDSLARVAKEMEELGKKMLPGLSFEGSDMERPPNNSTSYCEVSNLIGNVKGLLKQESLQDITSSELIQLYNYKEGLNIDYQKSLVASLSNSLKEKEILQEELLLAHNIICGCHKELHLLQKSMEELRSTYDSAIQTSNERDREVDLLKESLRKEISACKNTVEKLQETVKKQEREIQEYATNSKNMKLRLQENSERHEALLKNFRLLTQEHDVLKEQLKNSLQDVEQKLNEITSLKKGMEELEQIVASKNTEVLQLQQDKLEKEEEIQDM